ncbi:DegQ family serine endoprotease [Nitrospira moscoviensis]|uniref:Putative periplasmic serine endoprotease DegP-like n=1 Tax=Nitrospira moscoviensis TaxID=42253 RepID=A0A0K2G6R1_NITMO|nr:DegQ family serine endoprotease [Nitrospira moscoviensis]ALA56661.1 putative periplasmic serine endoprotease DegP-like [Nitrospira moscoviensis]
MSSHLHRMVGPVIGIGLMSGALVWGGHSLSASGAAAAVASPAAVTAPANGFTEVAKQVTPAVVNITTVMTEKISDGQSLPDELRERMEEFFGKPFGPRGRGQQSPWEHRGPRGGQGSGVIISSDGYILTNNHVIANAREVNVTLPDKREFKGKIVGTDPKTDLAVVKVDAQNLPVVPWGDASKLQVGEYVLAVGNPFGLNSTVTLGIVSAVGRGHMGITQYEDFIQTDAAINPGNSGGALVNTKGELVGINTAIFSQSGGYQGVGFAVSATMAKPIYESLVKTGKVVRGYLGIGIQDLNQDLAKSFHIKDSKGALVSDVKEDSPADQAGLKQGDVITEYQGTPVEDAVVLQRLVTRTPVGSKVPVKVIRDGRERELTVTVGEQPDTTRIARADSSEGDYAFAGVAVQDLDKDTAKELGLKGKPQGVVVTKVEPDSGAEKAGLMPGDVIKEINRQPVKSVKDFEKVSSDVKKGDTVLILINRRGNSLFLSAKV